MERMVLAIFVRNTSGVLTRVTSLFSRRGYNIDSLTVGETLDPETSRITVSFTGDELMCSQIKKQVEKLIDVIEIIDLTETKAVYRELVLVKVSADQQSRASVIEIANVFRAKVIDIASQTVVFELTGDSSKTSAFVEILKPYGITELIKTGLTGVVRGSASFGGVDD